MRSVEEERERAAIRLLIEELEAENERLREALKSLGEHERKTFNRAWVLDEIGFALTGGRPEFRASSRGRA